MDVNISEMLYTMSSLLFLILGIWLIFAIISAANPSEQIAIANMENLMAGMNRACLTGEDVTITFNLPQHTPAFTGLLPVMPIWLTRTNGDPNFVVYYEAFQPGDAIGWEVHHYMQSRVVAPLPNNFNGKTEDDVINYVTDIRNAWTTGRNQQLEGLIISNVLLGEKRSHYYTGDSLTRTEGGASESGSTPTSAAFEKLSKIGEWEKTYFDNTGRPFEGNNRFLFSNYRALNSFEKTAIKYAPCGDHSLCLKTRSAVQRFKLDNCGNIEYVELKYDARNRKVIYGLLGATLVVVSGGIILGAGGATAATITASGEVIGGTAALATATTTAPGTFIATIGSGTAATTVPVSIDVAATGTATAYTTSTAVAASGTTLGAVLSSLGSGSWRFAKGIARLAWKFVGLFPGMQTAIKALGTSIGLYKLGEAFLTAFLSYKVQDFHISSPCSINQLKIQKVDCSQMECENIMSYPIYEYIDEKLVDTGKVHRTCVEKAGTDPTMLDPLPNDGFEGGKCLKVTVEEMPGGFCWTPDPYRASPSIWDIDTKWAARTLGFMPISENTGYLSAFRAVVLKYYPVREVEDWKEWFERRVSWAWPGPWLSNPT